MALFDFPSFAGVIPTGNFFPSPEATMFFGMTLVAPIMFPSLSFLILSARLIPFPPFLAPGGTYLPTGGTYAATTGGVATTTSLPDTSFSFAASPSIRLGGGDCGRSGYAPGLAGTNSAASKRSGANFALSQLTIALSRISKPLYLYNFTPLSTFIRGVVVLTKKYRELGDQPYPTVQDAVLPFAPRSAPVLGSYCGIFFNLFRS
mmetsp:Transcript_12163/g.22788  ORF Transcript_12163/g.22788 Transcript_12163/m.22788 type:complete len:205 (-) Transcript_12163:1319-1933(-)